MLAVVINVPRDSKVKIKFVTGTDPITGAPIIKTKTLSNIKSTATDQDIYDTVNALIPLQKYPVDEIVLIKEAQLTE